MSNTLAEPRHVPIAEVARRFKNGTRQTSFGVEERSRYNRVARSLPYPPPSPRRERTVRGKAAVKALKRARQRARRSA